MKRKQTKLFYKKSRKSVFIKNKVLPNFRLTIMFFLIMMAMSQAAYLIIRSLPHHKFEHFLKKNNKLLSKDSIIVIARIHNNVGIQQGEEEKNYNNFKVR